MWLLFIPQVLAKENIDVSTTNSLNNELQKSIKNYNQVVENEASSWDDVTKCTDQIDPIISKINNLGMDVAFTQTSDVHINKKGETLPSCVSAEIKPYMLSKSYHFTTNENTSTVLAEVYGTNITTAEFMEKVYPGSLEVLPKDTVERLETEPMVWPDPDKIQSSEIQMTAINSSESNTADGEVTTKDLISCGIYGVSCVSVQLPDTSAGELLYMSYTKVTLPNKYTTIPEISVTSYIYGQ
ncbi:hypothetical protein MSWHS_1070 [Methanosarcina sp. WWM596]|nr:hypothetical protein MSWHS_1070 [Methanosarcina sp. WWM596]AKB21273.1 hypothetical protein MSWH1_1002 [Methanosarcina sp. WH1]